MLPKTVHISCVHPVLQCVILVPEPNSWRKSHDPEFSEFAVSIWD